MWSVPLIAMAVRTVGVWLGFGWNVALAWSVVLVCWVGVCWDSGVVWCQCSKGPWRRMSGAAYGVGSHCWGGRVFVGVFSAQLVR